MRVLLATDGSAHARLATRWLRDVPFSSAATAGVLSVATLTHPPRTSQTVAELRASVRAEAQRVAERAATILRRRWPRVETLETEGDPRVEIARVAEETRADLLVLGARGVHRLEGFLVGSTSLAAVRYAACPVAVVRGRLRPLRHALVAVDGSAGSRAAVRLVSRLMTRGARITLVHVLQQPEIPGLRSSSTAADRKKTDEILAAAATLLDDTAVRIDRVPANGDAAREIVAVARRRDADLIALGARGLHMVARLLLGSVSETVLHHAARPVLIVRE